MNFLNFNTHINKWNYKILIKYMKTKTHPPFTPILNVNQNWIKSTPILILGVALFPFSTFRHHEITPHFTKNQHLAHFQIVILPLK